MNESVNATTPAPAGARWPLTLALLILTLAPPRAARAQEAPAQAELPRDVAESVVAFYNAASTVRVQGDAEVPRGGEIAGPLAVLDGALRVAGRVRGDVVVINGDLTLETGAHVDGSVTVVGGAAAGVAEADVAGGVAVYGAPLRYRRDDRGIAYAGPRPAAELSAGREFGFGRTDFVVAVRGGYNRVAGLPISAGPRVVFGRINPTLVSARLIYRTGAGIETAPHFGYAARVDQSVGGTRLLRVGFGLRSEIAPIEDNGLSDSESSLATFLLHRDFRDHFERKGWSVDLSLTPPRVPGALTVEYRSERDRSVRPTGPWALFDNRESWRAEPVIADGTLRSLAVRYLVDTRNDDEAPSSGWYVAGEIERGLGGHLSQPIAPDGTAPPGGVSDLASSRFRAGTLDVRRYARLGPRSRLSTRVYAAGSLDARPLPAQRQHTLGGEGTLPGYGLFAFDCGAHARVALVGADSVYPYYGCDRSVLVQLEYAARLPTGRLLRGFFGPTVDLSNAASWVAFFDAGRAWTEPGAQSGRGPGQGDFAADAGLGLRLGRLGIYWALPLSGSGQNPNFFIRIEPRL